MKGQFLMAADSEKTAKLKKNGKIAESDGGYYLELQPAPQSAEGAEGQLIALFPGARPPTYEQARELVVSFILERLKS